MASFWNGLKWLWAVLITALTLMPSDKIEVFSWSAIIGIDKVGHMAVFGILYVLHMMSKKQRPDKAIDYNFLIIAALFGFLLEVLQNYMYLGRHFDVLDIIANIIGLLIAAVVIYWLHK